MTRQSLFAYFALLTFLSALLVGAHGHYCFDGLESPVSVHFDNLAGHPPHDSNQPLHTDADTDVVPEGLVNLFKVELPAAVATLVVLVLLLAIARPLQFSLNFPPVWLTPLSIRPPLRAPPQ